MASWPRVCSLVNDLGLLRARTADGSRSIDTVGNSTGLQVKEAAIADWLSVVPIDQYHGLASILGAFAEWYSSRWRQNDA
jgi:hypothetical protein